MKEAQHLLLDSKRVDIAVSNFPREKPIWVLSINLINSKKNQENERTEYSAFPHCNMELEISWNEQCDRSRRKGILSAAKVEKRKGPKGCLSLSL